METQSTVQDSVRKGLIVKPIDIPAGLHAVYTYDHERGWTCCSLVDKHFDVIVSGIARYNPKDYNDPKHPFDPQLGCHIALGKAVKKYNKMSNTKALDYNRVISNWLYPAKEWCG